MATYDDDITLSVNVTPGEVDATANAIKTKIEEIFSKTQGKELSSEFIKAQEEAAKLYDKIVTLQDRIKAAPANAPETQAYKEASDSVTQYKTEIESLEAEIKRLATEAGVDLERLPTLLSGFRAALESGTPIPAKLVFLRPIDELERKLEGTRQKLSEAEAAKDDLLNSNKAYDFSAYDELVRNLNQVNNGAKRTVASLAELSGMKPELSAWGMFKNALVGAGGAVLTLHKRMLTFMTHLGSSALRSAASKIKSLATSMSLFNGHARNSNNILEVGFKKLVQYGFGIRTIFLMVKKLRQALIDGFGSMTQYSAEFNNVVSQFVSALATLKLSFATAFAPIASVALPLLTGLMNALIDAMNLIGKFFAALTGRSAFIQAKRVQKDYAASLDKTGRSGGSAAKGIKKAEKAAKEAQKTIAGFDDVEILHDNSDKNPSSGSGGAGGGGGAGGVGDLTGADMFETVPIESKIRDFANKLRELIGAQDWTGLGAFLGQCINSIFATAKDLISWDNIGEKITFFVTAITTTFNSLVGTINWKLIGATFGEGINTLVNTINLFLVQIKWGTLGASLSRGLNSMINTINWKNLGKVFSNSVNAIIDFAYGAITKFNWKKFAKSLMTSLNTFLAEVDWKKLGKTAYELFIGILEFLRTAAREFDWAGLGKAIGDFLSGINWLDVIGQVIDVIGEGSVLLVTGLYQIILGALGSVIGSAVEWITGDEGAGALVEGIFTGITDKLSDLRGWLQTNLFDPFINGFKSLFGISSPSTVMAEQGDFIIQGLLKGITDGWPGISRFFSEGLNSITESIKDNKWVDAGKETVSKIQKGASNKWSAVTKFFSSGTKSIVSDVKNADWKGSGQTAVTKTESGISSTWHKVSSYVSSGVDGIISKTKNADWKVTGETTVSKLKTGVSGRWSDMANYFNTGINAINSYIKNFNWSAAGAKIVSELRAGIVAKWTEKIYTYFKEKITAIGNYIKNFKWSDVGNKIVTELKSGVSNKWATISDYFSDRIDDIKDKFNNVSWYKLGENICSGIKSGISNGWSWVTNKAKEVAEAAYEAARKKLDINSPSKLFRDGVGKAIPEGLAAGIDEDADVAVDAVKRLASSIGGTDVPGLEIPSIAVGKIIPYDSGKRTNSVDTTLADVANLLKYSQENAISRADIEDALRTVLPGMLRDYISFYIGDEQIARHANTGNDLLNRRFSTTG